MREMTVQELDQVSGGEFTDEGGEWEWVVNFYGIPEKKRKNPG